MYNSENEKKQRTAIINWADGSSKVKTYRTVKEMLDEVSVARFLGAKVCMWFNTIGWVWS